MNGGELCWPRSEERRHRCLQTVPLLLLHRTHAEFNSCGRTRRAAGILCSRSLEAGGRMRPVVVTMSVAFTFYERAIIYIRCASSTIFEPR